MVLTFGGARLKTTQELFFYDAGISFVKVEEAKEDGKQVKVRFRYKIRDEQKFPGLDELKAAIFNDIEKARKFFEGASK